MLDSSSIGGGSASAPSPGRARPSAGHLLRILGLAFGLAVMVGNTIGMGILRTPGQVAALLPSVPLFMGVWIAGAIYALLGALTVAELGAMRPRSGGLYPVVHHALGPFPGFLVGWTDWLGTCGSMAAVAMVLGEYTGDLFAGGEQRATLVAVLVVTAFALMQWRGIRVGDAAQRVTSLLKAVALVGLAVVAFLVQTDPGTTLPIAASPPMLATGVALASAVIVGLQSVIFTYDGWTGPVYFSEELREPGRDIPRSMIGGIVLVLTIYLLLNVAFLHVLSIAEMAGDPFVAASVARRLFGATGDTLLHILMILSLFASVNALMLMASRVPFAMSRDRLLPARLMQVNPGGTPVPSLALSTGVALVFIATNTIDRALALLAFFFVANYALTFTACFVMRRTHPDAVRPFRVPGYPVVPAVALLGSIAFLGAAIWGDRDNSLIALAMVGLSVPGYWLVRRLQGQ